MEDSHLVIGQMGEEAVESVEVSRTARDSRRGGDIGGVIENQINQFGEVGGDVDLGGSRRRRDGEVGKRTSHVVTSSEIQIDLGMVHRIERQSLGVDVTHQRGEAIKHRGVQGSNGSLHAMEVASQILLGDEEVNVFVVPHHQIRHQMAHTLESAHSLTLPSSCCCGASLLSCSLTTEQSDQHLTAGVGSDEVLSRRVGLNAVAQELTEALHDAISGVRGLW
jgi:hypothetical protein